MKTVKLYLTLLILSAAMIVSAGGYGYKNKQQNIYGSNRRSTSYTYSVPKYSTPKFSVPKYSTPKFSVPKYSTPKYSVPKYSTPTYDNTRTNPYPYVSKKTGSYDQTYYVGPRNGEYYINSNIKRTYYNKAPADKDVFTTVKGASYYYNDSGKKVYIRRK